MIVGTAGHIDHGKTTLVRALTGVDTDRLPEEKKRGISIELGYAFLDAPGAASGAAPGAAPGATANATRIGFIDVPGHERLVHTMLSGATGIDHALLLVAADDGVMPQTREHLAVLSLLGLSRGAIVITKADRVDAERLAAVQAEAQALVHGSSLAECPVFIVSAHAGEGLPALRQHLFEQAANSTNERPADAGFRLAIDRAFSLAGVGTVVTGTIFAGQVAVGDEVALCPSATERRARVRSLHAQNREVNQASAGQRCAVGLVGVEREHIARGQWLAAPSIASSSQRIDARLTLWHAEPRPLRSGASVHVHIGAASTLGTVAVLAAGATPAAGPAACATTDATDTLAPGESGHVQIILREPLAAWRGARVVLRDASASRTVAGGVVLDPFAPTRYRRTPERLAELAACEQGDASARLQASLANAAQGVDVQRWRMAEGLTQLPSALHAAMQAPPWALAEAHAQAHGDAVLTALKHYHAQHPDELGPDAARLRRLACPRLPEPLWRALLQQLLQQQAVAQKGAWVHLSAHGTQLSTVDERIAQKIAPMLEQAGFEGAWARDLARDAKESEPLMRVTIARLAQRGELHQVVRDLVYPNTTMARCAALVRQVASAHAGEVTAGTFRDATGLGRKRAIQILEYLDRIGMLRRVGDVHRLRTDTSLFT